MKGSILYNYYYKYCEWMFYPKCKEFQALTTYIMKGSHMNKDSSLEHTAAHTFM